MDMWPDFGGVNAICPHCHRYSKRVDLRVEKLSDLATIWLKQRGVPGRRISGFPQTMQWFIDQQGLDNPFENQTKGRLDCSHCRGLQKRKGSNSHTEANLKRARN